jgi:type III restriction enzyme
LGVDKYIIKNTNIIKKSIYDENFMEIDSQIEALTIDESSDKKIIVFAKLPKVNIPTAHGKSYNPDFGYVIEQDDKKELYFIVETKGYDSLNEISIGERLKIASAKAFFKQLKKQGANIEYKTKINHEELSHIINSIVD